MTKSLIAPTFLFRFAVPCLPYEPADWSQPGMLPPQYALPSFGELDRRKTIADLRVGWSPRGLCLSLEVRGKQRVSLKRNRDWLLCDGLSVWIDTRDTPNIHRATRFCHQFLFLPHTPDPRHVTIGALVEIERAREHPRPALPEDILVQSDLLPDGYQLRMHVRAAAMTGFEPTEYPRLGFTYVVRDQELGLQTFGVGPEYPFDNDRSLWGTLELIGE